MYKRQVYTTAGKAGFITALYIVLVPILGVFIRKKVKPIVWLCVILAVAGLYLLCMTDGLSLGRGDLLVLLCAFAFSIHILVIDYFAPRTDGVALSCIQFFVCGILSLFPMFLAETPVWSAILDCWIPILYAGVLSCGVAYTLQILAQKHTDPTVASLLLSLEDVYKRQVPTVQIFNIRVVRIKISRLNLFYQIVHIILQLPPDAAQFRLAVNQLTCTVT